jgi:hypothetical protein
MKAREQDIDRSVERARKARHGARPAGPGAVVRASRSGRGRRSADLRDRVARRREPEVAPGVSLELRFHDPGGCGRTAGMAARVVQLLVQPDHAQGSIVRPDGRSDRDRDRARVDLRVRAQGDLYPRDPVHADDLGHRGGLRRPVHVRLLRHRHRGHLRGRLPRPARHRSEGRAQPLHGGRVAGASLAEVASARRTRRTDRRELGAAELGERDRRNGGRRAS